MKTALFTNFTAEEFIGYWDGKGKRFAPGQSVWMPDYLARHFAKHLVNRELLRKDENGNLIYKDGEKFTSPKKPEEVPLFMDLFNKAFQLDESEDMGGVNDDIDALIGAANKNREARGQSSLPQNLAVKESAPSKRANEPQDPTKPQVVLPPDYDDADEDESAFGENKSE